MIVMRSVGSSRRQVRIALRAPGASSSSMASIVSRSGILGAGNSLAVTDKPERMISIQVARRDLAAAQALMDQIAALSPRVRAEESARLAECVYNTTRQLRRDYQVVWPPLFNNFLVNSGIKKRGLCFQWAEDLLVVLDGLKLTSLELHWGEAQVGTW